MPTVAESMGGRLVMAVPDAEGERGRQHLPRVAHLLLAAAQLVITVLVGAALLTVLAGVTPTYFGAESFVVLSGSMEPHIHVGSLAVVRPVRAGQLQPGDVITYRTPNQPDVVITHRLIAVERDEAGRQRFRTKGDANTGEDLVSVDSAAVLGKVVYAVPYAGFLVEFSKTARGRLLFIILPAALLAVDFLRSRARRGVAGTAAVPGRAADRRNQILCLGRRSLAAGHLDLAARAADGVLAQDPRDEDAWLLKVQSEASAERRRVLLETAAALNPQSQRLAALLRGPGGTGAITPERHPERRTGSQGSGDAAG